MNNKGLLLRILTRPKEFIKVKKNKKKNNT